MALVLAVALAGASAGATAAPRLASPRTAAVGAPYTLVVSGAPRRPVVTVRHGPTVTTPRMTSAGRDRWRATVTFRTAGAWTVTASVGAKRLRLGSIAVRAAAVAVANAVRVDVDGEGALLVADQGGSRVVRMDVSTRRTSVVATGLRRLTSVTAAPGGVVYATAAETVWKLQGGGRAEVAGVGDVPLDVAVAGDHLFVSQYGSQVRRIDADGHATAIGGFDRPHGVAGAPDGGAYVADTYAGAVRRISPAGDVSTIATGLGMPADVSRDADGSLLVADIQGKRIVRLTGGAVRLVARVPGDPTGVVATGGSIYVSMVNGPFGVGRVAGGVVTQLG